MISQPYATSCNKKMESSAIELWIKKSPRWEKCKALTNRWDLAIPRYHRRSLFWNAKTLRGKWNKNYKARWVSCGREKKNNDEVRLSPVLYLPIIRQILSSATQKGWYRKQFDFSNAFSSGTGTHSVCIELLKVATDDVTGRTEVKRLEHVLYGLKLAARIWHGLIESKFAKLAVTQLRSFHYVNKNNGEISFFGYELLIFTKTLSENKILGRRLERTFVLKDLGEPKQLLSVEQ